MKKLLNFTQNQKIYIDGEKFDILAKTIYVTQGSDDEYIKYILSDHKVLVVIPAEEMLYIGEIVKPFEFEHNFSEEITYKSNVFSKIASDYQIVKCVEFGSPQEVEGEVEWADYICEKMPETYISCAYVPKTRSRADIIGKIIRIDDIKI